MKNQILFLSMFFLLMELISSCKKPTNTIGCIDLRQQIEESTSATLIGKWNIVTDSAYNSIGCCSEHKTYYSGQTGDYFDFQTNGKLYTKEGNILDSVDYKLTSDTTILIASFGINGVSVPSHIVNLTTVQAKINSANLPSPGGTVWRRVSLSR